MPDLADDSGSAWLGSSPVIQSKASFDPGELISD